jgi:nucleobase transporter 1/2
LYAYIFTVAGVYDNSSPETQKACTTSQSNFNYILSEAPWFRVPYPGQWGSPIFTTSGVLTMLAAVIPAALESIGDYYAAARLSGARQPPGEVVSRALAVEAACCAIAGVFGTTSGSTAYAENVGAISITGVASRHVTQTGALIMIIISVISKIGALFASLPQAMIAGVFCVMFSIIAGISARWLAGMPFSHTYSNCCLGGHVRSKCARIKRSNPPSFCHAPVTWGSATCRA